MPNIEDEIKRAIAREIFGEERPRNNPKIGKKARYTFGKMTYEGIITDIRGTVTMNGEYADGNDRELPPYIEFDDSLQVHPSRVIFLEEEE